ncbi:hypothetical protein DTL42_18010 [Bremerella cremea]|uniref:Uncharacterized protein n=1 Tax=Bremerella cremea TaxID=1031537 RepID=A0A368KQ52_9BACT|nr:hypothetical protein [Bremerella cremea]RCS44027.1 hypothetical protein DTL42_18010 [Bremerella cremea]
MLRDVYRANRPLFELAETHPARQFLEAFMKCREQCVGRELPPPLGDGIDQHWWSHRDLRGWTFSGFAYTYISFTIELDGWLTDAPERTKSEQGTFARIKEMEQLLDECHAAATTSGNQAVLQMIEQVTEMLALWKQCIELRCPTA